MAATAARRLSRRLLFLLGLLALDEHALDRRVLVGSSSGSSLALHGAGDSVRVERPCDVVGLGPAHDALRVRGGLALEAVGGSLT